MLWSFPCFGTDCRLLKVDPMERATVVQVLEDSWLKDAPNTELQSPAVMMDKVAMTAELSCLGDHGNGIALGNRDN